MAAKFGLLIDAKTKGENNIKRLGNSMQGVEGKAKNLGMAVRGVGNAFKALFAAAAVAGFARFVKGAIDTADSFGKLEVRTGIAAEKLMAYVNAGKLADVSQKQLATGLKTLARTQAEAADGVATYSEAYAKLGLSVKKADGSLKPSDQLLGEIADKFADLPDGPEKAAIAMELFGKSGADMITLLNGGSKALEEFNYQLSDNFAQNAEFYNDQITKMGFAFDGFRMQLMDSLMPALIRITEAFTTLFDTETDWSGLFKVIEAGIRTIAGVTFATVAAFKFFGRTLVDLVKIADRLRRFDLGGAMDIVGQGLTDTREQFFKDINELAGIFAGSSEAPEGYGRRTGRNVLNRVPDGRTPGAGTAAGKFDISKVRTSTMSGADFAAAIEEEIRLEEERESVLRGIGAVRAMELNQADQLIEKTNKYKVTLAQVKDVLANQLTSAITGLIDGTKSLKESLSGLLKTFGQMFLQAGVGSIVNKIFPSAKGNAFAQNKIVPYANGGLVSRPTLSLMGEAGPEAVLPLKRGANGQLGVQVAGADMNAAMSRYARRGSGAAITTDDAAAMAGTEGGGSFLDVHYNVERINKVDYVTAAEFERGMTQAAKRGAELGRRNVYSDLVNKRSVRSRVGV